MLANSTAMP